MLHNNTTFPFIASVFLHVCLVISLAQVVNKATPPLKPTARQVKTVRAFSISHKELNSELVRIKHFRAEKKRAEQANLIAAQKAKMIRIAEQKKLKRLTEKKQKLLLSEKEKKATIKKLSQDMEQIQKLKNIAHKQLVQANKAKDNLEQLTKQKRAAEIALHKLELNNQVLNKKQIIAANELKSLEVKTKQARDQLAKEKATAHQLAIHGEINRYKDLIIYSVARRWVIPEVIEKKRSCTLEVQLANNGKVLNVMTLKPSGDPALDRSAIAAVYKASPLPVPSDPEAFEAFRHLHLLVRPEGILSTT